MFVFPVTKLPMPTSTTPKNPRVRKKASPSSPENQGKAAQKSTIPPIQVYDAATLPDHLKNLRMVWAESSSLKDNPENWRLHPQRQLDSLSALMKDVGWAGVLLYNETTGRLVDGHARKKIQSKGPVPVLIGRWTPEQERRILLNLDPISAMAEADAESLKKLTALAEKEHTELVEAIGQKEAESLQKLSAELTEQADAIAYGAPASFFPSTEELQAYTSSAPKSDLNLDETSTNLVADGDVQVAGPLKLKSRADMAWDEWGKGSNSGILDIPNLRTDRLAPLPNKVSTWLGIDTVVDPDSQYFYIWGSAQVDKTKIDGLIVAFYTEDEKFESVWNKPEAFTSRLLNLGVKYIVSPNYSCIEGMHKAWDIWNTYRSRWLCRYFQEAGFFVYPDLQLGNIGEPGEPNEENWKWRYAGIPKRCPCVAFEMQSKGDWTPEMSYTINKRRLMQAIKLLEPQSLLIYTPPDVPANYFKEIKIPYRLVETFMAGRSKIIKAKSKSGELVSNTSGSNERKSKKK